MAWFRLCRRGTGSEIKIKIKIKIKSKIKIKVKRKIWREREMRDLKRRWPAKHTKNSLLLRASASLR